MQSEKDLNAVGGNTDHKKKRCVVMVVEERRGLGEERSSNISGRLRGGGKLQGYSQEAREGWARVVKKQDAIGDRCNTLIQKIT